MCLCLNDLVRKALLSIRLIVFSKRDCLLVWKLVEYTFNRETCLRKDVHCEKGKQTVNASQDRYNITSWWNNLFRNEQIICFCQADLFHPFFQSYLTFNHSHGMKMTLEWHANDIGKKNLNCPIRKVLQKLLHKLLH